MADEDLKQQVDAYVDREWENIVKDIDYLVQVESVEDLDHAAPGMPYGPKPKEALTRALEVAARLGLDAHDCDGHIGYADLPGASTKQIATIAHTDIVPLGTGWHYDPLHVTRRDGYLLGRGVLDDKGPFVLSLYAAKFFVDQVAATGRKLPYTIRCLAGSNEETNMADVEWYLQNFPEPDFLFTPDADFPLICGEKGLYSATFTTGPIAQDIVNFDGGTVGNAIPGVAQVVIRADAASLPVADNIDIESSGEGLATLTAHGKGGHASMPEGTVNAIGLLVEYLLDHDLVSDKERRFLQFEHRVFASTDGSTLGIAATDDLFAPLTCIGGTIRTKDGCFVQTVDSRYPKSTTGDAISATLKELAAGYGIAFEPGRDVVPFYTDPNSPEIQTLVGTYNEYTGRHDKPYTIGGGTYARHFKNACAFGPHDPQLQDPDWVGIEHGPDEGVKEDQLKLALKIYIVSIARLMQLDL